MFLLNICLHIFFIIHHYFRIFLFPLLILFILNLLVPLSISVITTTYKMNYGITGLIRAIQGVCAVRIFCFVFNLISL